MDRSDPSAPHRLHVRVVADDSSLPVVGAEVTLTRGCGWAPEAITNADGVARIGIHEPAWYYLRAEHGDYAGQRYGDVRVARREYLPLEIDARMIEQGIELRLLTGATVRGEVRDAAGQPVAADVTICSDGQDGGMIAEGGRFAFEGLEPGTYQVRAIQPPYPVEVRTVRVLARADVEVPPIVLRAGASISGHVSDEEGRPVRDAWVVVVGAERHGLRPDPEDEGGYTIRSLPPGATTIRASADGFFTATRTIELSGPATVDFVLRRGGKMVISLAGDEPGELRATVYGAGSPEALGWVESSQTFKFEGLPDEPLDVEIVPRALADVPDRFPRARLAGVRPRKEPYEVALAPMARIGGKIDAPEDAPRAGNDERARFRGPDGRWYAASLFSSGTTYEVSHLPATATRVEIAFVGLEPVVLDGLRLQAGERLERDVVLARGVTLRGRVVDREGHGVSRAQVEARAAGLAVGRGGSTEADGTFAIEGLPAGAVHLAVKHRHFRASEKEVRTDQDAVVTLDPFE